MPKSMPPGTATASRSATAGCSPWLFTTARPALNSSRAVESLNRLSPCSTALVLRGMETLRRTAVAAAASGGATIPPSARPAAIDTPSMLCVIHATRIAVSRTLPTASHSSGARKRLIAPGGKSKAASTSTGAMNRARYVSGSMLKTGVPGMNARMRPAPASMAGYGSESRRATCSSAMATSMSRSRLSKKVIDASAL